MLPLSVINESEIGTEDNVSYILYKGRKISRLHLVGSIASIELNQDINSGYIILDDTFSTILMHFQSQLFNTVKDFQKGNLIEAMGSIEVFNQSITINLMNIKKISLSRYAYNKIESIKNMIYISNNGLR